MSLTTADAQALARQVEVGRLLAEVAAWRRNRPTIADARARITLAAKLSGQYVTRARRHLWVGMGDGAQTCARPGCGISRFAGWAGETALWEYQDGSGKVLAREWKTHPVGAFPRCRGQVARRRTSTSALDDRGGAMKVTLKLGALEAEALMKILVRTFTADPHARAAISSICKQMGALEAKREKRRSTSKLWDRLMERSGGKCECGCGQRFASNLEGRPTMDHWHGRAKAPENEETCWLIRWGCHDQKTRWRPSRTWWTAQWVKHRARVSGGTA